MFSPPRFQAESSKEEKDVELTQARGRLGEYERVGANPLLRCITTEMI